MAEDWKAVAAEVEAALASIGDVSQPSGYPATIRKAGTRTGGPDYAPEYGPPTYHPLIVLVSDKELRDINGTLIGMTKRTVTISGAAGVVPSDDDQICMGQALAYVDDETDAGISWQQIQAVRELAPGGIAVLFDLDLGD